MTELCSDCGAELVDGSKFCSACGKSIEKLPETPKEPEPQKQVTQPKAPKPVSKSLKKKKKFIIGMFLLIIAVILIAIVIVFLLGGTNSYNTADSRFVGDWEQNSIQGPLLWRFNNDGSLMTETSSGGLTDRSTWKVNNTALCLHNTTVYYSYVFSNNGNMLLLNRSGGSGEYPATILLTKKGQQGTSQTPTIECTTESATNRVIITYTDPNVKWKDITITTNPTANWQVQDTNKQGLAKIGTTSTISTYVTTGDNILVLETIGDVIVTLKYIPTNAILGNWTVNI